MISLNFSSVDRREPLAEGIYVVRIDEVTEKVSSTGKDMLSVKFMEQESRTVIFDNYVLTPNALWKLAELFNVLGYDTSQDMDFDFAELVGAELKAKVVQEEYNGNIVNRIKKLYSC